MMLLISALLSFILSLLFALKYKRNFLLLLTLSIPILIVLEILITKDIAAFYYRYYYHWLFLIPLLLVLPLSFLRDLAKPPIFIVIIILAWIFLFIRFPVVTVFQNIKYLNTDSMWFDSFSRKFALRKVNIYDYINWQFPKTKGIIKWCENREAMTDLYALDPQLRYIDDERGFKVFLVKCNYKNFNLEEVNAVEQSYKEIINKYPGVYYLSLEQCSGKAANPFTDKIYAYAYEVDQRIICASRQIIPYLYVLPEK